MLIKLNNINERAMNKVSNTSWGLKSALLIIHVNALAQLGDLLPLITTFWAVFQQTPNLQTKLLSPHSESAAAENLTPSPPVLKNP